MSTGHFKNAVHCSRNIGNIGKSAAYSLLLDVTSDIIGRLNRRIMIPLRSVQLDAESAKPVLNGGVATGNTFQTK